MKKRIKQNIFLLAGIIAGVIGIMGAIPSLINSQTISAILFTFLFVIGLILLAIGFGD